jgi:hypothetical protein
MARLAPDVMMGTKGQSRAHLPSTEAAQDPEGKASANARVGTAKC